MSTTVAALLGTDPAVSHRYCNTSLKAKGIKYSEKKKKITYFLLILFMEEKLRSTKISI